MRDQLVSGGRSATTANFGVALLKRAFGVAVEKGLLQRNPVALVRSLREQRTVRGTFTVEQLQQLLIPWDHFSEWYGLILAGWYTGARLGDLQRLQWSNVSLEKHFVSFAQGKTGGTVKIPLHPELEAWLTEQLKSTTIGVQFVFPTLARTARCSLSRHFGRLVAKILPQSGLCFHSLRHSFTTALCTAGVPADVRMKLTGHADARSHAIYSHHEFATLQAAIEMLPRLS
jgi:integrase